MAEITRDGGEREGSELKAQWLAAAAAAGSAFTALVALGLSLYQIAVSREQTAAAYKSLLYGQQLQLVTDTLADLAELTLSLPDPGQAISNEETISKLKSKMSLHGEIALFILPERIGKSFKFVSSESAILKPNKTALTSYAEQLRACVTPILSGGLTLQDGLAAASTDDACERLPTQASKSG